MIRSWEDEKNIICDMYLEGYRTKDILKKFNLSFFELAYILGERKIPLRGKGYNGNWFYCPNCRKWIPKIRAIEKRGKRYRKFFCPFCGGRLRTKPRHKGGCR